jgi:hypothetical protein
VATEEAAPMGKGENIPLGELEGNELQGRGARR